MRVGILTAELTEAHGWGRYALDLMRALASQNDIDLAIAASSASPGPGEIPHVRYGPLLPALAPARRGILPRSLLTVPHLRILFQGCDVIHATAEHYLPAAVLAAGGRPVFATAHGTYLPMSVRRQVGPLFRWAAQRATILPVSQYTADRVWEAMPAARMVVIPNGVHVARFAAPPEHLPAKRGPTVLSVGVNKARKGFHVLLEAVAQARATLPAIQCVIIGSQADQAYTAQLRALVAAYGLADHVQLLGRVSEAALLGWYHTADVFALPAINVGDKFEGFGLVYLEAGAAGLPVIGTLGCGAEEAIVAGETGLLIPQSDAGALAAALVRLLEDPALRAQLGAAGQARAAAYSWARIAAQVRAAYTGAVGG